jgi:hypothetical protein
MHVAIISDVESWLMDHPNTVKVFDGGATAAGRPYFVMELVKDIPISATPPRFRQSLHARNPRRGGLMRGRSPGERRINTTVPGILCVIVRPMSNIEDALNR